MTRALCHRSTRPKLAVLLLGGAACAIGATWSAPSHAQPEPTDTVAAEPAEPAEPFAFADFSWAPGN
jgi:hypothetical protein